MERAKYLIYILVAGMAFLFQSCADIPSDFQAPRFDVTLNFPITDTLYTIDDALKGDSTLVPSTDPSVLGLLYYRQTNDIETFFIKDNLSLNGFSTRASQVIGSVKINNVTPIQTGIKVEDWTSNVSSGSQMIFPENLGDVNIAFPKIEQFNSVSLDGGTLTIKIINNLPVDTELRGILIRNAISGTTVAQKPESEPQLIAALDSLSITFDLAGKTIEDSLRYIGKLYSPGSGGNIVDIPADAGTKLIASFDGLSISSVTAVLPAQDPFRKDSTVVIDDSTFIDKAVFEQGSFEITFDNNLDLDINLNLKIDNLLDPSSNSYNQAVFLKAHELNHSVGVPDLSGWSISKLGSDPTNELSYSAVIAAVASTTPKTLSKNDSIAININFGSIVFRSVSGKIKPTTFSIAESSFGFDLGDVKSKFKYTDINFNDPAILLKLKSSAKMEFELNGTINATNGTQSNTMNLDNVIIASQGSNVIDLRDYGFKNFINGFDAAIPDSFIFAGDATVNPNFSIGSVSKDDSVSGGVEIQIPLDVGIAGGTFLDTLTIDSLNVSDSTIDAINYAELTIELSNEIPVGIAFTGKILDANDNELFTIPPSYNSITEIKIEAPSVNSDGFVVSAANTTQTIQLKGEDAKTFIHNPKIAMKLTLETPPAGEAKPVK